MTDRELLESLKAQIDAQLTPPQPPDPIDEVIEWRLTDAGPLSACQPTGFKSRSETWTAVTIVEAANGGKVYDGPRTQIRFNDKAEACVYIPPVVDPSPVWPPKMPDEPTKEEITRIKSGLGYPQPRRFSTYQWHDSELNDPNNMRHVPHIEFAHPRVVGPEILRIDVLSLLFHGQGSVFEGLTKMVPRVNGAKFWMPTYVPGLRMGERLVSIPEGAEGHMAEFWTPLYLDLRGVTQPDFYSFEIDSTVIRPDRKKANARAVWKMWVDPTGRFVAPHDRRLLHAEGWVSSEPGGGGRDFSYLPIGIRGVREYVSDPPMPIVIEVSASAANVGQQVELGIFLNPDMHQHPAHYGKVVPANGGNIELPYRRTITLGDEATKKITIPHPEMVLDDRLVFRVLHMGDPTIGAGATLVGGRVCAG